MSASAISASEALEKLKQGNQKFVDAKINDSDVSLALREKLVKDGQNPFAVVISCSDSRVIPEDMFMCGLGDIFTVRVAGNIIDKTQAASVAYAVCHLGCNLVVLVGHTHCGAVGAAVAGNDESALKPLLDKIKASAGASSDETEVCKLNVKSGIETICAVDELSEKLNNNELKVVGAIYNTDSGKVDFI